MQIEGINYFSEKVYKSVLRLLPQLSVDTGLPSEEYFKQIVSSENVHFFVALTDDDNIIGMLTIGTYNCPSGKKTWIEDVVVDEACRGKGYGEELMLFAIEYSKGLGSSSVMLTSRHSRVAANKLYQKMGFTKYDTNVYKYLF